MSLDLDEIERIDKEWDNPLGIIEENGKKYIDGEEILLELKLVPGYDIFIKTFLIICNILGALAFFKANSGNPMAYIVYTSFFFFLYLFINMCINIYKYKFYITENHFITYRGIKVHKDDIYLLKNSFSIPVFEGVNWKFYSNDTKLFDFFIGSIDDVNAFNSVMYKISKNKIFYLDTKTYTYRHMPDFDKKIKLISD